VKNRFSKLLSCIIVACTLMVVSIFQGADDVSCRHRLGTFPALSLSLSLFTEFIPGRVMVVKGWGGSSTARKSFACTGNIWLAAPYSYTYSHARRSKRSAKAGYTQISPSPAFHTPKPEEGLCLLTDDVDGSVTVCLH